MFWTAYRVLRILYAKFLRKPLALCDVGDADGMVSAALFLRKYPNGVVIFAAPREVHTSWWIKRTFWTFVADLPCPGKVLVRVDHHKTNKPCAKYEFYDPDAPCAALLAQKALDLEDDEVTNRLVKLAVETDTANIKTKEARELDLIVRYSSPRHREKIAKKLALEGIDALQDRKFREWLSIGERALSIINELVTKLPKSEFLTIYVPKKLNISYRQLSIELQKKGVKMVNILVKLGLRTYRLYCGADRESIYDCTRITSELGGGGHKYAAGAQFKVHVLKRDEGLKRLINVLKNILNVNSIEVVIIKNVNDIEHLKL